MKKPFLFILLSICLLISLSLGYFLTSPKGAKIILETAIDQSLDPGEFMIDDSLGNLLKGITYENIEIKNIHGLPVGSQLKIQKLFIQFPNFNPWNAHVDVLNARLFLPESDPVILRGKYQNNEMDVNVFSNGFSIHEVTEYLPKLKSLIPIKGTTKTVDLYLKKSPFDPHVNGSLTIEEFLYKGFTLKDCDVTLDLFIENAFHEPKIEGKILFNNGILHSHKTTVNIQKSFIKFTGPWNDPELSITGFSTIDRTKINISLKGTIENPHLILTSEPSLSKDRLMLMLATGKKWSSLDKVQQAEFKTADLTKDFVDYFFFAGKSNQFAKKLGIYDVSVKFTEDTKGIGAKKDLTDKLGVGYSIEQQVSENQSKSTTQTIQGEYKVTDKLRLGVEKEVNSKVNLNEVNEKPAVSENEKVYIKFKKEF
ncbi:MAG: translocation/assembly module TamB domain-containing protein [Candidatus Omnitrophica bacterium]|nr:translocation/assembly module TamB domain-containing protein [Candidatus Omnitrophota bacterium]